MVEQCTYEKGRRRRNGEKVSVVFVASRIGLKLARIALKKARIGPTDKSTLQRVSA